jgi:hypothetical protein
MINTIIAVHITAIAGTLAAATAYYGNLGIVFTVLIGAAVACILGASSMTLAESINDFSWKTGAFVGRLTIDHHDYIVSSAPPRVLADTLGVSQDTIANWPYWHDTTDLSLSWYALDDVASRPSNCDAIIDDCMNMMTNPRDDRGGHMVTAPSLDSIQGSTANLIMSQLISTRQILDDTADMMHDMEIPDDGHVASLLQTLRGLEKDADKYRDDEYKLKPIMNQIRSVRNSSKTIHNDVSHLYRDIIATRESSRSMVQLGQKISVLRNQTSSVVE